jgi:hypothetical protein
MSKSDVGHFAETKHKGLPEKVAARSSRQRGFFAAVRSAQKGERPLHSYGKSVSDAAKKMQPKDANESSSPVTYTPTPQEDPPPEVSSKMSSVQVLFISDVFTKVADIQSSIGRAHKAVHQAGAARRQMMGKEIVRLQKHNQQLLSKTEKAESVAEESKQKVREAEMKVMQAGKTIEQIQAMQMSQRPQPPPEQPAYGAMLMGGMPGAGPQPGAPTGAPPQSSPTPQTPSAPSIPGMQAAPQV